MDTAVARKSPSHERWARTAAASSASVAAGVLMVGGAGGMVSPADDAAATGAAMHEGRGGHAGAGGEVRSRGVWRARFERGMLLEHAGGAYSCCKGGYIYDACLVCFALPIAFVHVNEVIYFVRTE